jgi:hypothetical protein
MLANAIGVIAGGRSRAQPDRTCSRASSGYSARAAKLAPPAHLLRSGDERACGPGFSAAPSAFFGAGAADHPATFRAGLLLVAFTTMVSIGDTYFVGRLGTEPLAGLALVFPMLSLLQMTSAGAMGGGVSSAIARALGAGDQPTARRLVVHALVIAGAMAQRSRWSC